MTITIPIILPLISAILVFSLGIFVFLKNKRSAVNIIFSLHALAITVWLFGTFMMFSNRDSKELAIFWDRFIYAGVVFIPIFLYHFSVVFCGIKNQKKIIILGYILSSIFLILSRTNYFVADLFEYKWGVHTKAKFFHHIFLIYFSSYVLLWFYNIRRYYRSITDILIKQQIKYVFVAFLLLFTIGPVAYLPAYGIGIYPFAYLSGVIFAVILTYAILKHHLMNVRVMASEIFVAIIAIVLLIEIFPSQSFSEFVFRLILFLVSLFIGYLLIKSVLNEIKLREKLEIANNAKSEFVSIASHQLRTPLTAVKGYISMIIDGSYGKLSEELHKPLQNVYDSNEKLINLVNDLLNLSRLEAGKIESTPTLASLEKIIAGVIDDLKINADKKGLYIKLVKSKKALPEILVDQPKIRQVALNIIDNAIKYTKRGGITINLKQKNSSEQIIISDTGVGISQDEMGALFKMFSRAETGMKLHTGGSGVGLHVAKKFVEMHHGRIWAESEGKGKGSSFYIELPIKSNGKNPQRANN